MEALRQRIEAAFDIMGLDCTGSDSINGSIGSKVVRKAQFIPE